MVMTRAVKKEDGEEEGRRQKMKKKMRRKTVCQRGINGGERDLFVDGVWNEQLRGEKVEGTGERERRKKNPP